MGFRFSKSIKLFPGVRLNLSRGGISASVGRPGATINIGRRGVRATTGIPGSGLSYSTDLYRPGRDEPRETAVELPATALPDNGNTPANGNTWGTRMLARLFGSRA